MEVCRKLGNIKLEKRPYTEVSPYLRDPRSGVAQAVTDRVLRPAGQVMSSGLTRVAANEDLVD